MSKRRARRKTRRPALPDPHVCEADAAEGLEDIARQEITARLGRTVRLYKGQSAAGTIPFLYTGPLRELLRLQTVGAVYLVRHFDVPRPRALLGDATFRDLLTDITRARRLFPDDAFQTLHIAAAGEDSPVMQRLQHTLAQAVGLAVGDEEGDLWLRLRRPPDGSDGWEVLTRLSPRPLATRPWRVCNMEGALNATVAHAMALLTDPRPDDTVLNICCGSGTLLIERLAALGAGEAIGYDLDPAVLDCAAANIAAAGYCGAIDLRLGDAGELPVAAASVDAILGDLPFGHLVGSHEENLALYPALLQEAARVARPGATCVLITHEVRLMESLLADSADWQINTTRRVLLGGLYPRIFVLTRQ